MTVADADGPRDFYAEVLGWRPHGVDMGGWSVSSLDEAVARAERLGAEVLQPAEGGRRHTILRDPAGAPFALFEQG